jgi:Fic family protein
LDYIPAFNRYPPSVLQAFGRIERARGAIETAQILPAQEEILRRDALVGSIHYSNVIEGNELSRLQALRALEHELEPDDKARLELVNYVAALNFIAASQEQEEIKYTPAFLKRLHGVMSKGLGRPESRFKPHHEGEWRDGQVFVSDGIELYHEGADSADVGPMMEARLEWLERRRGNPEFPTAVLAGVAHFEIAEVHPFADYNGRAARLFATAIFYREHFIERRVFSPERYYAEDKERYYAALRAVKRTRTLDAWLFYYVDGLAVEFERVAERVRELNALTRSLPLPLQLSAAQEKAVAAMTVDGRTFLTITDYAELGSVSSRTASRDLNGLVDAGVLRAMGSTQDRRFALALPGVGRPRRWTTERITSELAALVEELGRFPTYADFSARRSLPLYAAIQREGGLPIWARQLGYRDEGSPVSNG